MISRASAIGFLLVSSALGGYYGLPFFREASDKSIHLPGETSHGHYQIELACNACHTPYGGVENAACMKCHGAALEAANNSHTEALFNDPRNADRASAIDARVCVTCHREHVPERTRASGVTVPVDFCVKCHQEVYDDRPTHQGISPTSCQNAGCHNFHDNRGVYEGFLQKHMHEPDLAAVAKVATRTLNTAAPGKDAPKPLKAAEQDAPAGVRADPKLVSEWEGSVHAKAGVNCTGCHNVKDEAGAVRWQDKIDHTACASCHANEDNGFLAGKHGMRLASHLSPMTPGMARQPMKDAAKDRALGCASCHGAHGFDTGRAAVDACLGCHDDKHSQSFKASRHFKLWEAERTGAAAPGTGVSCATCHLPREEHKEGSSSRTVVQHNQNDNLRPNDKMIRSVCMSCHGAGFTIDSLADADLVQRNFNGRPSKHVESIDMAERRLQEKGKKGE